MISERCEPAEFVRAAQAWDRSRLDRELEREIAAAELVRDRAGLGSGTSPSRCHQYIAFLRQLRQWLIAAQLPRPRRHGTRELITAVARALAEKGQLDPKAMDAL